MQQEIDYAKLGNKIKKIRNSKGYTQEMLSELVGCNTSHISNIENNHTKVSLNVLFAIANALDTSIDFLLFEQYSDSSSALNMEIQKALDKCSLDQKEKLLKIIEIL